MNPRAAQRLASNAILALGGIGRAVGEGHPADQTLHTLFRSNPHWGSRDRRFISQLVFSFFRWRGWLRDLELERAAALAYSLEASGPHEAHTALAGCEMPAWHGLAVAEKMSALAAMTGRALSLDLLVPEWLTAEVAGLPRTGFHALIESFQTRPPTWVRAREGRAGEVLRALQDHDASPRGHACLRTAIACEGGVNFPEIRKRIGPVFEIQDIASQAVGPVCAPNPGERWWDVCCGSGGKALHLADLMGGRGELVATDVRASALEQLAIRAKKAGCRILRPLPAGDEPEGLFDGLLVDAPCSGIGTWSRNPDMRWRTDADDVRRCADQQLDILLRSASFVKRGGTLVFAVCTITRAETTDVVRAFQDARTDFVPFEFVSPLSGPRPPSSELLILPAEGPGDGMFIARFRRRA